MRRSSTALEALEAELLNDVSVDLGWALVERFAELVRESGTSDEDTAADYIVSQLQTLGVSHTVYVPELFVSLPRVASVTVGRHTFSGKPPAFAASTGDGGVTAEAIVVGAPPMQNIGQIFEDRALSPDADVRGRIVVTNGYAMPSSVRRFEQAGAVAQIYINPGDNVHWGICTSIWGTPTHENLAHKPHTPILAINQQDGSQLLQQVATGVPVTVRTELDEGWKLCKVVVADIPGRSDDYLLVHGHYDSWDVGIGDNAVGDATLLELSRIFHGHRTKLARSIKIAWWPGHSTGRYAGSTWFADEFAIDLAKRCVAAINIDSPGCQDATAYEEVMWMAEAQELCRNAIKDRTDVDPSRRRPIRAGDYSFNQIGLSSFFMLLSNIPAEEREARGYYPVGGCGGNIAWHTEDDLLNVADRDCLRRDLSVYVTAIHRVVNSAILPFDYRRTVEELSLAVGEYEHEACGLVDFSDLKTELLTLQSRLDEFYSMSSSLKSSGELRRFNDVLRRLARILVPLGYSRGRRFEHDPALPLRALPLLEDVAKLRQIAEHETAQLPFLQTGVRRRINYVANALCEASEAIGDTM